MPVPITAKVALLDEIVSKELARYAERLITLLMPAGIVMAVTIGGAELVDVASAVTDELDGPTTVTRTSTV